jgi:hypothetical protein
MSFSDTSITDGVRNIGIVRHHHGAAGFEVFVHADGEPRRIGRADTRSEAIGMLRQAHRPITENRLIRATGLTRQPRPASTGLG